jgi:hypothetical protein
MSGDGALELVAHAALDTRGGSVHVRLLRWDERRLHVAEHGGIPASTANAIHWRRSDVTVNPTARPPDMTAIDVSHPIGKRPPMMMSSMHATVANVLKMASHRSSSCRAGSVRTSSPSDALAARLDREEATSEF